MSFTCCCGCRYFTGSIIQGGNNLDLSMWSAIECLSCEARYLYHPDLGFKTFNVELVK